MVRCSPSTTGVPSLHLDHSIWVLWWMKRGLGRFLSRFLLSFSYHKFHSIISPHSSHSFLFHFVSPCDVAADMVGQHSCYSLTFNIGDSSHCIPRPSPVLDTIPYSVKLWSWRNQMHVLLVICDWLNNKRGGAGYLWFVHANLSAAMH